ncbi:hypothetical protein K2X33_00440 [bacterium]|nr:hypothetical protein [bacterium]
MSNAKTKPNHWFSRKALAIVAASFLLLLGIGRLCLDTIVRRGLEGYASRLNGAQVNIGNLSISLLSGQCNLRDIQIAHHADPMTNLVEIGEIHFQFEFVPLLSLKLIIPELSVETVRYKTKRSQSGGLDYSADYVSTAALDRVSSFALSAIRSAHDDSRLRNLGQLSLGIGAKATVSQMLNELETQAALRKTESEFEKNLTAWEEAAARLGHGSRLSNSQEREGDLRRAENLAAKVTRETESLLQQVNALESHIPNDVQKVTKRIGLPHLDSADFTEELLGKRVLNHLERISYWVELSRRRMTYIPPGPSVIVGPYLGSWGHQVHYTNPSSPPRFLLKKATIRSVAGNDSHAGNLTGLLTDLSSDPNSHPYPFRLDLEAEFPGLRIFGAELHGRIDHTRAEPVEQFEFSVDSFPMSDWYLEQSPELKIGVNSTHASLTFQSDYRANQVSAQWNVQLRNSEFNINSRFRQLEGTLRDAFAPYTNALTISGSVSGDHQDLKFHVNSDMGKGLAAALGERFTLPLRAAEESISTELTNRFYDPIDKLRRRVTAAGEQMQVRFKEIIADLKAQKG